MIKIIVILSLICCFKISGQNISDYMISANNKKEKGNYQGAVMDYTKAIELSNIKIHDVSKLYSFRAFCKEMLNDYRGAIIDLNESIKLEKAIFFTHYDLSHRAKLKEYLRDYKGALIDISRAIEIEESKKSKFPSFTLPDNYLFRGQIKFNLNQKDSGCIDFSTAGQLGQNHAYEYIKKYCN